MFDMRRREFITLLGGAAAWPLVARGQQVTKLPTVGFLGQSVPAAESQRFAAFEQRLRELGWIEARTIAIEIRWTEGRSERAADIAAEFVRLKVDVIVTSGTPQVAAAKQTTSVIPIVFALAGDPVGTGLVASLARPGGNVTGLSVLATDLPGKRIELLREAVPWSPPLGDYGQCQQSCHCGRNARVSEGSEHARPRIGNIRNPANGGYRARLRVNQGPR
jgi:ABC transporter substrate binding protein